MRMLSGKVAIRLLEVEERTAGGIIKPDESKEKEQVQAEVLAVCDDWNDFQPFPLNVGDKVLVPMYCGVVTKFRDKDNNLVECRVASNKEILAII